MMVFVKYVLLLFTIINLITHSAELCYEHPQYLPYEVLMHQAIYSPSQTAVYLFGGRAGSGSYPDWITDVYKWDKSQPNSWFEKFGSIPSNTNLMTSYVNNAVVAGGRVYFIGIQDQQNLFLPYVYDLQSEDWITPSNIQPPPDSLTHGCLAASETHIYMVAGTDLTDADRQPLINVYEIASDSWTSVALDASTGLQPNRGGWNSQYCAVVENHLYVFGGNKKGLDSTQPGLVAAAFRMDLSTHSIEQLPSMPEAQAYGRAVHHQGKIYFVGGSKQDWVYLSVIRAYDIATQTYSAAYDAQFPGFDAAGVLALDGLLYIFGGGIESTEWFTPSDLVRICELPTNVPTSNPTTMTGPASEFPSDQPTNNPTGSPTSASDPSEQPSNLPTFVPSTVQPSSLPSIQPSLGPSEYPSQSPTGRPTDAPSTRAPLQPPVVSSTTDQQQRGQLSTTAEETSTTTTAAATTRDPVITTTSSPMSKSLQITVGVTEIAIIGVVILSLFSSLCGTAWFIWRRRRSQREQGENEEKIGGDVGISDDDANERELKLDAGHGQAHANKVGLQKNVAPLDYAQPNIELASAEKSERRKSRLEYFLEGVAITNDGHAPPRPGKPTIPSHDSTVVDAYLLRGRQLKTCNGNGAQETALQMDKNKNVLINDDDHHKPDLDLPKSEGIVKENILSDDVIGNVIISRR